MSCPVVVVVASFSIICVDMHPCTILLVRRLGGGGGGWTGASYAKTKTVIYISENLLLIYVFHYFQFHYNELYLLAK